MSGSENIFKDSRFENFVKRYQNNPYAFAVEVTHFYPSRDQKKLFNAIIPPTARVSVVSGTGTGKTACFARIALWHLLCHPVAVYDGKVEFGSNTYIGAPNIQQVADGIWKELQDAKIAMANNPSYSWLCDYFEITKTKVVVKQFESQWFISQIAFQKGKAVGIAGKHRYWQLMIIDEAAGVSDEHFNVIDGTQTQAGNRTLLASQGVKNTGRFFDSHHSLKKENGGSWDALVFDSEQSPFVSKDWLNDEALTSGGRNTTEYRVRVKGEFVENTNNILMTRDDIDRLLNAGAIITDDEEFGYILLCDVSLGQYRDDSVLVIAKVSGFQVSGPLADRKVEFISLPVCVNTKEPIDFAGDILNEFVRWSNASLYIDAGGVGAAVINCIKKNGVPVKDINWGNPCFNVENRKRFYNQRAQAMVCFKEAVKTGRASFRADVSQRVQQKIIEEGTRIPYHFSEAGNLRYVMDSKEEMAKNGIKSPDLIDAMSFAFLDFVTYMVASESYAKSKSLADKTLAQAQKLFENF